MPPVEELSVPCIDEGKALSLRDEDPADMDCIAMFGMLHAAPCPIIVAVEPMFIIIGSIIITWNRKR